MTAIELQVGDITKVRADVIVNAANSSLLCGGGVDGAIHKAGGPEIIAQCRKIRKYLLPDGLPTGHVAVTTAGNLDAVYIFHAVGPNFNNGEYEPALMKELYLEAMKMATFLKCKSIAFPAISTGAYGWPVRDAARIALKAVKPSFWAEKAIFVLFDQKTHDIFTEELGKLA